MEARFAKLNKIARPVYPTLRPIIVAFIFFGCLFVAAAMGIARGGQSGAPSGFQIMGQSACFILPVLVILWIRLRKDSSAKARKHVCAGQRTFSAENPTAKKKKKKRELKTFHVFLCTPVQTQVAKITQGMDRSGFYHACDAMETEATTQESGESMDSSRHASTGSNGTGSTPPPSSTS